MPLTSGNEMFERVGIDDTQRGAGSPEALTSVPELPTGAKKARADRTKIRIRHGIALTCETLLWLARENWIAADYRRPCG
jgi:hypothetical protein